MLVLSRQRDEEIVIGGEDMHSVEIKPTDVTALMKLCPTLPELVQNVLAPLLASKRNVRVTVVDIRGDKVRLGIDAPGHLSVHRREVYNAILREQKAGLR